MVLVSYSGREINAKLVYYGPGLSGKTTNLEYIYGSIPNGQRGKMVSMKTKTERTLFFDFLPVHLGELSGFKTRFLLYTVPGQVYYNATRKLVLKGVDAVVFVADSKRGKMDENIESLENLRENLREHGLNVDQIPWVIQYNKRDLADVYSVAELEGVLNAAKVPSFEAVATTGEGVVETFKGVSRLLLKKLAKEIGVSVVSTEAAASAPPSVAPVTIATPMPRSAPRPITPTPAWSAQAPMASTAVPAPPAPRPAPAPEWGQEPTSWDAPARPPARPEPPQPRPAVFERIAPEPPPATPRREALEPHEPLPFPRLDRPVTAPEAIVPPADPEPTSEFCAEALAADPVPEPTAAPAAPPPTESPVVTLPPAAERIDARSYLRSTAEKEQEKVERPNTVGERLRRWLSRNQEKETGAEETRPLVAPVPTPPVVADQSEVEPVREPIRFSDEEQAAITPDLSSRSSVPDSPPEIPPEETATVPSESELDSAEDLPGEEEWPVPSGEPVASVPTSEPVASVPTSEPTEDLVKVALEVEVPPELPIAPPMATRVVEAPATPADSTPALIAPPARMRPPAPIPSRRPREIVVPIEIHPEDLENGISLKLALQAPWWEEQRNGEEMQGAA